MLLPQAPTTLDPRHASDAASARVARLLYLPLVDFDEEYRPQPVLADWEALTPTHYRIRLRAERATFHDGSPVTAEDVRATYDSVLDPAAASPLAGSLAGITAMEVRDAATLDFHLKTPDALFAGRLTLGILPARLARATGEVTPIGSGPFRLLERRPGGDLLLERRSDGRRLWLRGLQDGLTRLRRIEAGEADIAQGELGPALLRWAAGRSALRVLATPGDSLTYLGLNLRDPALADLRLRRALSLALDRNRLASRLLDGRARPASGLLGPGHWAGGGSWPIDPADGAVALPPTPAETGPAAPTPADPPSGAHDEARRLFLELGISPTTPLQLSLATSANPERLRLAAALAAELEPFGVQLDIASRDWAAFYAAVRSGRFQTCLLQWVGLKLPDIYRHAFHSASMPPAGANRGGVDDATLDALIEAAEAAPQADAPAAWRAVRAHVASTLPQIPLWFEDATAVVGPRVRSYRLSADGSLDGLAGLHIE